MVVYAGALAVGIAALIQAQDWLLLAVVLFGFVLVLARRTANTASTETAVRLGAGFLSRWATLVGVFGLSVMLLNMAVNPYGEFSHRWIDPITLNSRRDKVYLYAQLAEPPEIVILGSSRSFTLSPTYTGTRTGLTAFNASVDGGTPVDYLAFAYYMLDQGHFPRVLILEVSVEQVQAPRDANLTARDPVTEPLGVLLDPDGGHWVDRLDRVRALLTLEQLDASLRAIRWEFTGRPPVHYRFDADGLAHFYEPEPASLLAQRAIQGSFGRTFAEEQDLSTAQMGYLAALLDLCRAHDTQVIIYLPPYHPLLASHIEHQAFPATKGHYLRRLAEWQTHYDLAVFDFTGDDFGDDASHMFYDGIHPTETASNRMIDTMIPVTHTE
jgi:hypothetical protein